MTDLASCQDLRRRTLAALHGILDDLRARGVRPLSTLLTCLSTWLRGSDTRNHIIARQLSPKYRLLTSSISFASIRLSSPPFPSSSSSPSCSDDEPFELSGKIDARGPARRTSAVLREELAKLEDARRLDERGETFVVFPTGRGRAAERAGGPTLVMT
jgi:hypothetical protein